MGDNSHTRGQSTGSYKRERAAVQGSPQQVYQPRRVETLVASTPAPSGTATQPSSSSLWSSPFRSSQSVASGPPTPSWRSVSLPERASPPSSPSPFAYSSWNPLEELERSSSPTSSVEQRSVSPFSVGFSSDHPRVSPPLRTLVDSDVEIHTRRSPSDVRELSGRGRGSPLLSSVARQEIPLRSTNLRRRNNTVAQTRWSPMGLRTRRVGPNSTTASKLKTFDSVPSISTTQVQQRSKSPDTEYEGEPLSEEEPEVFPMAQWNTQSSSHLEHSARAEAVSPQEGYYDVNVKLESPRRSLSRSVESENPGPEAISVICPQNARPPRHVQLGPLKSFLARAKATIAWDKASDEQNPLYAFSRDPMMHIVVMDTLVHYLQQHSFLARGMSHNVAVVPPSIYQLVLCSATRSSNYAGAAQAVWQHAVLPTYIVVPVVHDGHWFVWRGAVWRRKDSDWECDLRYLSSLGRPPQDVLKMRARGVRTVVRALFPQLQRVHTWHHYIDGFKQKRGSSDCGLFAAQAVSAFVFEQPGALEDLLPVAEVGQRIVGVLKSCATRILEQISEGFIPKDVGLLHNHRVRGRHIEFQPAMCKEIVYLLPSLVPLLRGAHAQQIPECQSTPSGLMPTASTDGVHSDLSDSQDSQEPQQRLPQSSTSSRSVTRAHPHPGLPRDRTFKCTISFSWEDSSTT